MLQAHDNRTYLLFFNFAAKMTPEMIISSKTIHSIAEIVKSFLMLLSAAVDEKYSIEYNVFLGKRL